MRVEIYNPDAVEEQPPLRLKFVQLEGGVRVNAVGKNGEHLSCLLVFTSGGKIYLYQDVDDNLGLDLTATGTIKVVRER